MVKFADHSFLSLQSLFEVLEEKVTKGHLRSLETRGDAMVLVLLQ